MQNVYLNYTYCFKKPLVFSTSSVSIIYMSTTTVIKTHGSEWRGQERVKRIAKNKTRDELLCVFYTKKPFHNNDIIITVNIS